MSLEMMIMDSNFLFSIFKWQWIPFFFIFKAPFNCISNDILLCWLVEIKYVTTNCKPQNLGCPMCRCLEVSDHVSGLISGLHTFLNDLYVQGKTKFRSRKLSNMQSWDGTCVWDLSIDFKTRYIFLIKILTKKLNLIMFRIFWKLN